MITLQKTTKILCLLLIAVIVASSESHAKTNERIRGSNIHYQPGDWITYSMTRFTTCVALGNEYVYFGTTGGITRYNFWMNEWNFPWTTSNGLADNYIENVAFDRDTGFLWCSTKTSISYLEPASQRWYNEFYDELGLLRGDWVELIGVSENYVWLKTATGKILRGGKTTAEFTAEFNNDFSFQNDSDIRWSNGGKKKDSTRLPNFFLSGGYLFDDRGYIRDMEMREFKITCSIKDNWQSLWVGTWGLGAARGDMRTIRMDFLKFGLWDEPVDALAYDGDDLWVGGINDERTQSGVTLWRNDGRKPEYFEPFLLSGFYNTAVTAIAVDDRYVWFGTQDGLTRYDKSRDTWFTFTQAYNLVDNYIHDLLIDEDYVWIATAAGVSRLYRQTLGTDSLLIQHVNYPALRNVEVFDIDSQQNLIWMATEFGIYVYDIDTEDGGFYSGVEGPANRLIKAVSCYQNEVWFGTIDGIEAFDADKQEWLPSPARRYRTDFEVNRILADRDAVWAVTGNGVLKYDRQFQRWVHYSIEDGLVSNNVFSLLLDGDYIWFGSDKGLTRFYWNDPTRSD